MKYRSNKNGDFIIVEGRTYRVERRYFHDADEVAPQIVPEMFEKLATRKIGMNIITVGDTRFILGSFPFDDTGDHVVQLSEVRIDGTGIKFTKKIPFLEATGHYPLLALVGGMGEAQISQNVGEPGLGSIAQIIQQGITETLEEGARAQAGE